MLYIITDVFRYDAMTCYGKYPSVCDCLALSPLFVFLEFFTLSSGETQRVPPQKKLERADIPSLSSLGN